MKKAYHNLLKRQIKRHFADPEIISSEMADFIESVNEAYWQSDDDRNMLERSLELSSSELLQANSELKSIFQAFPDLFFRLNREGNILEFKGGTAADIHFPLERILGRQIQNIPVKEISDKFSGAIEKIREDKSIISIEYSMKISNSEHYYEARLVPFLQDEIIVIVRNITERKMAEKTLRESEERYRKVLESSPDPIIVYDMEGMAAFVNPAFQRVFGWTSDEVLGKPIKYVPGSNREDVPFIIERVKGGGDFQNLETRLLSKDGRDIDISMSAAVWRNQEGSPVGSVVTLRDVTNQKDLEAKLQQAQKMEAIGTLAGGLAHDFNNLLMGIMGNTSLMIIDSASDHPDYERIESIEEYVRSGAELTKRLLGFAQGGKYEVKPINLNDLLRKSVQMFGRTKKEIQIHLNVEEKLWTVDVDRGQIEQVLLNIFVNAWKAMPGGGDLSITTENVFLDEKFTGPYRLSPGRYVKVSVKDTGIGIKEADRLRIFDPFFTTKEMGKGTGLGLASAYGIIKNHGGMIQVDSEVGKWTIFSFHLPAVDKEIQKKKEIPEGILMGTESILLVDDEELILNVGGQMLSRMGYHVHSASGGKEATEIYLREKERIDMVILDMIMPGMDGGAVFDMIKVINPAARVLLSSGYSLEGRAQEIMERGCDGFIQKPFNLRELSHKIREVLD